MLPGVVPNTMKTFCGQIVLVTGITVATLFCARPAADPDTTTLSEFNTRVKEYVALHRTLARETGEIDETKDPQDY